LEHILPYSAVRTAIGLMHHCGEGPLVSDVPCSTFNNSGESE
jgi:hypothetical protein